MKNQWKKPELVVLVRSRPEESVLDFCKVGSTDSNTSAQVDQNGCQPGTKPDCTFCVGSRST